MGGAWWERLVFQFALAFWSAYFAAQRAAQEAERELPDDKALAVRDRFRAAVLRYRVPAPDGPAGPVGTASGRGAG